MRRYVIGQPYAILREVKQVIFSKHFRCIYFQHQRFAMPGANLFCGSCIGAKVYMMPFLFLQSRLHDGIDKLLCRAMIQYCRRLLWYISKVNLDRVALAGPDPLPGLIKGKSFLVATTCSSTCMSIEENLLLIFPRSRLTSVHPFSSSTIPISPGLCRST